MDSIESLLFGTKSEPQPRSLHMPPIQVIPELWYDDDRCFDGCAGPLIVNGNKVFGCTLPAQTATLEMKASFGA